MKKSKRRNSYLLLILLLFGGYFYLQAKSRGLLDNFPLQNSPGMNIFDEPITSTTTTTPNNNEVKPEENDVNIIKEYFVKGMGEKDYIAALNAKPKSLDLKDNYVPITYDFDNILTYTQLEEMIRNLSLSKAVAVDIIGQSVDKRNIYSLAIGFGKKYIMFEAGIHAAEIGGPLFIIKYINDLVNKYEKGNEKIIKLLNEVKIIIIPSANPDGYEATLFGYQKINNKKLHFYKNYKTIDYNVYKANARGVDLNRNMPSQHAGLYYSKNKLSSTVVKTPSLGYFDYYPGSVLGSEPEIKAIISWQNRFLKSAYAYVALHSQGRVIYVGKPNLSTKLNNNSIKLANLVYETNDYIVYGPEFEEVGYGTDGTTTDYASELACGFTFSKVTGRLAADNYLKPTIKKTQSIGIITLETMITYSKDPIVIKKEYDDFKLAKVFDKLIESYKIIK